MEEKVVFDINEIVKIIPHRYPFLLVDKVLEFVDNEKIVALKNATMNESFFQGHFPHRPVMPGVLVLEAMAQTAAIFAIKSQDGADPNKTMMIVGADQVKWKKAIEPGDTLIISVRPQKKRRPLWTFEAEVSVAGKLASRAVITAMEVG